MILRSFRWSFLAEKVGSTLLRYAKANRFMNFRHIGNEAVGTLIPQPSSINRSSAAPCQAKNKTSLLGKSAPKGPVAHLSHFGHTFVTHLSHALLRMSVRKVLPLLH